MGNKFTETLFTESVKKIQTEMGSRKAYQRGEGTPDVHHELTENEAEFIEARDSFYMATVGSELWPYIQHRGGQKGFVKILNNKQIGFADYSGNRQYISVGNLTDHHRAALFFMDYPNQTRLKLIGNVKIVSGEKDSAILNRLSEGAGNVRVERGMIIDIVGFDWNCPQFISPRWTEPEIRKAILPLQQKIADLELEIKNLKKE